MHVIDLNADLGEGTGDWLQTGDAELLDIVSSANVACGFHAGDATIMRRVTETAAARGVRVGAHVGYRDRAGFGRRPMAVDPATLHDETLYQVGALQAIAVAAGTRVSFVKPHGALYHAAAADAELAGAIASAVAAFDPHSEIVGPPGSHLLTAADRAGLSCRAEGFADRRYAADGALIDRAAGGLLDDVDEIAAQAVALARGDALRGPAGGGFRPPVATICLHGDSPGAVRAARAVRAALVSAGIRIGV